MGSKQSREARREKRLAKKACTESTTREGQSFNTGVSADGSVAFSWSPGTLKKKVNEECVQMHLDKGTFKKK